MATRRSRRKSSAATRVRHLVALDASRVMARLAKRQGEVVRLFSRLRDRAPLMRMVEAWFSTASFSELSALEPLEQLAAHAFHEHLEELRWYLQYTEDMPLSVQSTLDQFARKLDEAHRALVLVIGTPENAGAPVVDAEVVARVEPSPPASPTAAPLTVLKRKRAR